MEFITWEPVYETIVEEFEYDRSEDEAARDRLATLTEPVDPSILPSFEGRTVAVVAPGPSLDSATPNGEDGKFDPKIRITSPEARSTAEEGAGESLRRARAADAVVAVSRAAEVLRDAGVGIDCIVTDLDGSPETAVELTREGVPVAVHAHGDNRVAIETVVPDCDRSFVVGTTQAEPIAHLRNDGGFTDGDRAAFLADALGAEALTFPGWLLDDPAVRDEKSKKLRWAERLLYWLETRRGERFELLDGRRDGIDTAPIPIDRDGSL